MLPLPPLRMVRARKRSQHFTETHARRRRRTKFRGLWGQTTGVVMRFPAALPAPSAPHLISLAAAAVHCSGGCSVHVSTLSLLPAPTITHRTRAGAGPGPHFVTVLILLWL